MGKALFLLHFISSTYSHIKVRVPEKITSRIHLHVSQCQVRISSLIHDTGYCSPRRLIACTYNFNLQNNCSNLLISLIGFGGDIHEIGNTICISSTIAPSKCNSSLLEANNPESEATFVPLG